MDPMIEKDISADYPNMELDPDDDSPSIAEPIDVSRAFPVSQYRELVRNTNGNSARINELAGSAEVLEYFAHRYWHGNRLASAAQTPEEAYGYTQNAEYQEARVYLRDYGYLAAGSVKEMLIKKYSFTENDLFGFGDKQLVEAYFEAFEVPAFSMSDAKVAEELKRVLDDGSSVWDLIRAGNYLKANSLLRDDIARKYPRPVIVPQARQSSSSLAN